MKKFFQALTAAAAIFICALGFAAGMTNEGYIEGEGFVYPEPGESPNALRRTAELMAYRDLAEQVETLHISSATTVREAKQESDVITVKVDAAVRGAKIVSRTRNPDGSFQATVRLPIFGSGQSLANAVLPENVQVEDLPQPKITNLVSGANETYTGLVIDCRGKNISTAITPSIKAADGTEIYAFKNVTRQMAAEKGMVNYSDSLEGGAQMVGGKALTVKAIKISGECDAVVSDEDASKILIANQTSKFLNNCMVVFVR